MTTLYWTCLGGGLVVTVALFFLSDLLGDALDGAFDALDIDGFLDPLSLVAGVSVFGGAGIVLDAYTGLGTVPQVVVAVIVALVLAVGMHLVYVAPMKRSENSTGFSVREYAGRTGELSTSRNCDRPRRGDRPDGCEHDVPDGALVLGRPDPGRHPGGRGRGGARRDAARRAARRRRHARLGAASPAAALVRAHGGSRPALPRALCLIPHPPFPMLELLGPGVIVAVVLAVILVLIVMVVASRYKTVSPDEAMIITGGALGGKNVLTDDSGRRVKIVRGGGAFIVPVLQQREYLSLLSHKLDVSTPEVYTSEGVPVMTDSVALIKVGSSVEDVATAAEQFLGKPDDELRAEAREVLEGHLRAILGTLTVEEVYRNRDKFAQEVQSVAALDLRKMGLQIVSFTIKDVRDNNGYLEALGRPRIAAIKRDADIAEAEAIRDSRVRKAAADEAGQEAEQYPRHQRRRGDQDEGAQGGRVPAGAGHRQGRRRPGVRGPGGDVAADRRRGADAGRARPQAARGGPGKA